MTVFTFDLTHIVNKIALFARGYFAKVESESQMSWTFWRASLVIKILIDLELEVFGSLVLDNRIAKH